MTSIELHKVMNDFQNRFSRASDQVKNINYPIARGHIVYDDIYHDYNKKNDNNEVFEEEEEESLTMIQLTNINELSNGFEEVAIEYGDEINNAASNIDPKSSEKPKRMVNTRSFQRPPH